MAVDQHAKSERIDIRVTPAVKQLLQNAAQMTHKNVSEFLLEAGMLSANQTLADRRRFQLDDSSWQAFQQALDRPVDAAADKPRLHKLLTEPSVLENSSSE